MNFLTFDLGTTLYKVAVFDSAGKLLGVERAVPPIEHPAAHRNELLADDFLSTLKKAAFALEMRLGREVWEKIGAVSFATQANTFTLLDKENRPTTPFVLWSDERAADMADNLAKIASLPDFRRTTGMPRFSHFLALAKIAWMRRGKNDFIKDATQLCFLSDYLAAHLTGSEPVTEAGVAALSGALDIRTLQWRDDILAAVDIPPLATPTVRRAGTDLGAIEKSAADAFNLLRDCRVVLGCLDQYAGAIGTGTVLPNMISETTGTVLAAVRCSDRLYEDPAANVFQGPGFDADRFFQMSFSSNSANLLNWYRDRLPFPRSFEELTRDAENAIPPEVQIEPYDSDAGIEASFRNVRPAHTSGQIVRGIMMRVAESLAQQIRDLSGDAEPHEVRSAGGAARNDFWLQMKADTVGVPFVAMDCEEPTSLGAAMLAARAMGLGELPDLTRRWVRVRKRFESTC